MKRSVRITDTTIRRTITLKLPESKSLEEVARFLARRYEHLMGGQWSFSLRGRALANAVTLGELFENGSLEEGGELRLHSQPTPATAPVPAAGPTPTPKPGRSEAPVPGGKSVAQPTLPSSGSLSSMLADLESGPALPSVARREGLTPPGVPSPDDTMTDDDFPLPLPRPSLAKVDEPSHVDPKYHGAPAGGLAETLLGIDDDDEFPTPAPPAPRPSLAKVDEPSHVDPEYHGAPAGGLADALLGIDDGDEFPTPAPPAPPAPRPSLAKADEPSHVDPKYHGAPAGGLADALLGVDDDDEFPTPAPPAPPAPRPSLAKAEEPSRVDPKYHGAPGGGLADALLGIDDGDEHEDVTLVETPDTLPDDEDDLELAPPTAEPPLPEPPVVVFRASPRRDALEKPAPVKPAPAGDEAAGDEDEDSLVAIEEPEPVSVAKEPQADPPASDAPLLRPLRYADSELPVFELAERPWPGEKPTSSAAVTRSKLPQEAAPLSGSGAMSDAEGASPTDAPAQADGAALAVPETREAPVEAPASASIAVPRDDDDDDWAECVDDVLVIGDPPDEEPDASSDRRRPIFEEPSLTSATPAPLASEFAAPASPEETSTEELLAPVSPSAQPPPMPPMAADAGDTGHFCLACHALVPPDARFCPHCGRNPHLAVQLSSKPLDAFDSRRDDGVDALPAERTVERTLAVRAPARFLRGACYPVVVTITGEALGHASHSSALPGVPLDVRLQYPGCAVTPASARLDAQDERLETRFWVTPLSRGRFPDGAVEVYQFGERLVRLSTPFETRTRAAMFALLAVAVAFPVLSALARAFREIKAGSAFADESFLGALISSVGWGGALAGILAALGAGVLWYLGLRCPAREALRQFQARAHPARTLGGPGRD